jgi:hypothetical protein
VPLLLSGISKRAQQHRAVALRVATAALSMLQQAPGGSYSQVIAKTISSSSSSSKPVRAVSLLPPAAEDRAMLLSHALKVMLYQRPSSGSRAPPTPLGLANAAAAAAGSNAPASAAAAAAVPPPAGLSTADVALLEEKGVSSQDQLVALKLGLLALLGGAAAGMPGNAPAVNAAAAAAAAAGATAAGVPSNAPAVSAASAAAAGVAVGNGSGTGSGAAAGSSNGGASGGGDGAAMDVDSQAGEGAAATAAAGVPSAGYLSSEELLLVLLAASCDPYEAVAR